MPVPSLNYCPCISLLLSRCSGNSVFLVKSITFQPLISARSHAILTCQENLHRVWGVTGGGDASAAHPVAGNQVGQHWAQMSANPIAAEHRAALPQSKALCRTTWNLLSSRI